MNRVMSTILIAVLFVSLLGMACDDLGPVEDNTNGGLGASGGAPIAAGAVVAANQVEAMQLGSTAWGIARAMAGRAGTQIFSRNDLYCFSWAVKGTNAWAFWLYDARNLSAITNPGSLTNGQAVSVQTMSEFVEFMKTKGWSRIEPGMVPTVLNQLLAGLVFNTARNWTTFVVLFPPGEEFSEELYKLLEQDPGGWE